MTQLVETTYTDARERLAQWLDRVTQNKEVVVIRRRGHDRVALIDASELNSLIETAHLLRSPRNAARLLAALQRALSGSERPQSLASLRRELRLEPER